MVIVMRGRSGPKCDFVPPPLTNIAVIALMAMRRACVHFTREGNTLSCCRLNVQMETICFVDTSRRRNFVSYLGFYKPTVFSGLQAQSSHNCLCVCAQWVG